MTIKSIIATAITLSFIAPMSFAAHGSQIKIKNTQGLNPKVLHMALSGYQWAVSKGKVKNKRYLTVVDYSKPSSQKRLWVIDLKKGKVKMKLHVSHGVNTGGTYSTRFSNKVNSRQTSLGVFTTANTYYGKHGLSLRLNGLERGINNNARKRAIVVHPAKYVSSTNVGRSWGCLALNPAYSKRLINLTKGGSVIFAYGKPKNNYKFKSKKYRGSLALQKNRNNTPEGV